MVFYVYLLLVYYTFRHANNILTAIILNLVKVHSDIVEGYV